MAGWIDVHTHLNFLEDEPAEALKKAKESGVDQVITIGTEPKDHPIVIELAEKYFPQVHCTIGVHPHEGIQYNDEVEKSIRSYLVNPKVVAVAEIGLDFYYNHSPKQEQIEAFRRQMDLAIEFDLPVQIHTRDAEAETIEVLKDYKSKVKGLIHCFTGSAELGRAALDCGFDISFSGVCTFKKAENLRDFAVEVPLDRLHVETDAPFLAPVPKRGKKNTPAYVVHTAELISQLKSVSLEELKEQTRKNAAGLFPRIQWVNPV